MSELPQRRQPHRGVPGGRPPGLISDLLTCLSQLPSGLGVASLEATEREATEALWLAAQMGAAETSDEVPGQRQPESAEEADDYVAAPSSAREGSAMRPPPDPGVTLWHRTSQEGQASSAEYDALPLRLHEVPELREPLELQRALRPLKRMVKAGLATALDEEATVKCSADACADAVLPVWRHSAERWFCLALVVDVSPSMILWDNLVGELQTMLAQLGAFRAIRTWELRLDGRAAAIAPLRSTIAHRSPRELIDPAGRQAILVVTDCVDSAWQSGGVAMDAVATWARTGPLALLQPLEQRMWSRSTAPCQYATLRSPEPGAPNGRLIVDEGHVGERPPGVPVPILEIDPDWFAGWARLVCGDGPVDAVVTFAGTPPDERASDSIPSPEDGDGRRAVERFMAGASPDAFRLAGLLAEDEVPLTLPLMRHIQRKMVPDSRPLQLAEVFLGGLLCAVPADEPVQRRPAGYAEFAFPPDVRDVLRGTIRRSEAKLVRDLVRVEFSRTPQVSQRGISALIPAALGTTGTPITETSKPYSEIDSSKVAARGGDYAAAASLVAAAVPDTLPDQQVAALAIPDTVEPDQVVSRPTQRGRSTSRPDAWVVSRQFTESDRTFSMTLLGAPGSGKTTFLAALSIALARKDPAALAALEPPKQESWRIHGSDSASTTAMAGLTDGLIDRRSFPVATYGIERMRFELIGRVSMVERRWALARRRQGILRIGLDLADVAGALGASSAGDINRRDLIDALAASRAIIFLFDPVSEFERGDFFAYTFGVIAELAQRMLQIGALTDGVLPHHVSMCIAKFDDIRVLQTAAAMNLLFYDADDPYGFPRVHDDDARNFFLELSRFSPHNNAELARLTIERYFRPERVKYFVTSAIGFHVDPVTGTYDHGDFQNVVSNGSERIRSAVHPINVAEPVLWLTRQLVAADA